MEKNFNRINNENISVEQYEVYKGLSNELVNKNYWESNKFRDIYFQRKLEISTDDKELKEEYVKWHKELGLKYYNPNQKKFIIDRLDLKERLESSKNLLLFIEMHPILRNNDRNYLLTLKKSLANNYLKTQIFNSLCGIVVLTIIYRKIAKRSKLSLNKVILKNTLFSISLLLFSFFFQHFSYRLNSSKEVISKLYEADIVEILFQNYLRIDNNY